MLTQTGINQILQRAEELIEKYGWIKGWDGNKACGFCGQGAIREAIQELRNYDIYSVKNDDVLRQITTKIRESTGIYSLVTFNDGPNGSKKAVLKLFRTTREKGAKRWWQFWKK